MIPTWVFGLVLLAITSVSCAVLRASVLARSLWYRAIGRTTGCRAQVPPDGPPLTDDEMHAFVGILRGWKQSAAGPRNTESTGEPA